MAGSATSAAVVPRLLQLARGSAEPACKEQLPAAVLDLLLPASAPSATAAAHVLLQNLGMALQQCSRREAEQLHAAVQSRLAEAGPAAQAAVACAVQLCYQRLTARLSAGSEQAPAAAAAEEAAGAAEGAAADGPSADAAGTAVALFVLGPFSSPGEAESCMAEARLLLRCLEQLAAPPDSTHGASSAAAAAPTAWLLSCLTLAWQQLAPTCLAPPSAGSQPSQLAAVAGGAVCGAALAAATLRSLHGLLLSPCCTPDVRRRCLEAAFALPPAAQGPLRLLQALTAAAGTDQPAAGCAGLAPAGAAPLLQLDEDDELRIHPAAGSVLGEAASLAEEGGAGEEGHSASGAVAEAAAGRRQLEQQHGLVALLDLLGGLASTYERHKVDFLQQLSAGPGQQHQQQSRAGRPLRPAAEWWVGGGAGEQRPHEAGGELERPAAAASADGRASQPGGAASEDYMGAEDEAAKHEAAAQLYVESLLDAADTAPACYLPLLERLAREAGDAAPAAVQASFGGISMLQLRTCNRLQQGPEPLRILAHSFLQAAALRALGRLALLSQPLSARAVALAERALQPSAGAGPGSRAATEVQQAAVSVLAEAISAFPNSHSDRLLLIGQLMVPLPGEPGPARAGGSAGSCEAAEGAAGEGGDGDGSAAARERQQQEQLARCAAAAYCRLLLHNRLKLQGMLGPVGVALARGAPPVAALVRHALRQLLLAGAPKERARLAMALFHQTPLACRLQLAEVRAGRALAQISCKALHFRCRVLHSQ